MKLAKPICIYYQNSYIMHREGVSKLNVYLASSLKKKLPYRKIFGVELGNPGHHCMCELGVGHFEAAAILEVISHHGVAVVHLLKK